MDQTPDNLPPDLEDVGRRLTESRTEPTPLEMDALWQRVHRRADAPRGAGALRRRLVALLLTLGLLGGAGASVAMATGSWGGGGGWPWPKPPGDSGSCQYKQPFSKTYTYGKVKMTYSFDCKVYTLCLECTDGKTKISSYQLSGSKKTYTSGKQVCITIPADKTSVTVTIGGKTYTFPLIH